MVEAPPKPRRSRRPMAGAWGYDRAALVAELRRAWAREQSERWSDPENAELADRLRALSDAADAIETCGRDYLSWDCPAGCGIVNQPVTCGHLICPDCARRESARVSAIYTARIDEALARLPSRFRKRMVTLAMKPREGETARATVERCRRATRTTLRVLVGVPSDAAEWRVFFELHAGALARYTEQTAERTKAGRPRTSSAREREARARLRRETIAERKAHRGGWVTSLELGERSRLAHSHSAVVSPFLHKSIVSLAWRLATGADGGDASFIADVRALTNPREALKYATKFGGAAPRELLDVFLAFHGRRRVEAYGCLRAPSAAERAGAFDPPAMCCPQCGAAMVAIGRIPAAAYDVGIRAPPIGCGFVHGAAST